MNANKINIWTNSIYTIQLQGRMEESMAGLFGDDTKEVVRKIIKEYHLKAIDSYPELKEY